MVKLRLKRLGKKFQPVYRIVAIQSRTKREGESLEELGFYSSITKELKLNKERLEYWLSVGAQATNTVERLMIKGGIIKDTKAKKNFKKEAGQKSKDRAAKAEEKKGAKVAKPEVSSEVNATEEK